MIDEQQLRQQIEEVRSGERSRRTFLRDMMAFGFSAPFVAQMLAHSGVAMAATAFKYAPEKAGGGGTLKLLVVAGPDAAQPAFRGRHQGPGRLAHLLRAAGGVGPGRQPGADPRRRNPQRRGRHGRQGRQVGHLEAEAGRQVARRPAVHRRRLRVQLGIRRRPGHRGDDDRHLQGHQGRQGRRLHDQGRIPEADAVLGRCLRRRPRHDHPEAPVRELQGRQIARGAGQPRAGRHRPLHVRRLQARRSGPRQDQPELPHAEPALFRHDRDEGRRRCGLGRARGAADRRIRFRLEHAGRGRNPEAPGGRRQGPGRHLRQRQHRAHPAQQHRSEQGGRRRAVEHQDQASVPDRPGSAPGAQPAGRSRLGRRNSSTAAPARQPPTSSTIRSSSSPRTRRTNSTSTRRRSCSTRPAGSPAPTACARRTA